MAIAIEYQTRLACLAAAAVSPRVAVLTASASEADYLCIYQSTANRPSTRIHCLPPWFHDTGGAFLKACTVLAFFAATFALRFVTLTFACVGRFADFDFAVAMRLDR